MTCYHVKYMAVLHEPLRLRRLHIGVYGSLGQARVAIAFLSEKPGFRAHPHAFYIYRTFPLRRPAELNRTHLITGFDPAAL